MSYFTNMINASASIINRDRLINRDGANRGYISGSYVEQAFSFKLAMEFKIVIIVGFCFAFASAQFKTNGTCPNFDECRDPNIEMTEEKIRGIWYLASSIPYFFQLNKKCTYVNITAQPEPNRMHFDKIEYDIT